MTADASVDAGTTVAVCIATRCRVEGLDALLHSLSEQLRQTPAGRPFAMRVIVADNDPRESARPIAQRWQGALRITYVVEPRPGVAHIRNTCVAAAEGAEFLAFVDDDEVVDRQWLAHLLAAQREFDADVVTGPVVPTFTSPPPTWLRETGYLMPMILPSGEQRPWAATNNTLARKEILDRYGPFDPRYGLTGGEDKRLFAAAAQDGRRIIWCADAIVREGVGKERLTLRWHLKRGLREGNHSERIEADLDPGPWSQLQRCCLSVFELIRCAGGAPIALLLGRREQAIRGVRMSLSRVGALAAVLGFRYEQYGDHPNRWSRGPDPGSSR